MKKLIIAAFIMVAAGTSAFAADVKVNSKVKTNFDALFSGAENISWSSKDLFVKASFTLSDETIEAYFGTDGELIGTSRKVDLKRLPLSAVQKIKKEYAAYQITESIEFERAGERSYYVSLEKGNKKQILEVSLYGNVTSFREEKK
jgi:opacity protein-like surface antigen